MLGLASLSTIRVAFFGTAATVIPVFMIAIAVNFQADRVFSDLISRRPGKLEQAIVSSLVYLLVVVMGAGELTAIGALFYGSNAGGKAGFVFVALIVGTVIVFIGTAQAVLARLKASYAGDPEPGAEQQTRGGTERQ